MVNKGYMRSSAPLITLLLLFAIASAVAQMPSSAVRPEHPSFPPPGPFLFGPGSVQPTYIDPFDYRPVVKSPDGSLEVAVTGPKKSLGAWVTVVQTGSLAPGFPFQVWPIEAGGSILWRPDSSAFAFTDYRYADMAFVLIFGTDFNMGNRGPTLGVPMTDLTPVVRRAFAAHADKYYSSRDWVVPFFYVVALRWIPNDQLLVGLKARTWVSTRPGATVRDMRVKFWYLGYVVDVSDKRVVSELSEAQLLSEYGIKVAK